jgi:hypothetical protein
MERNNLRSDSSGRSCVTRGSSSPDNTRVYAVVPASTMLDVHMSPRLAHRDEAGDCAGGTEGNDAAYDERYSPPAVAKVSAKFDSGASIDGSA